MGALLSFPGGQHIANPSAPAVLAATADGWRGLALGAVKAADEARARGDLGSYWRHLNEAIRATERAQAALGEAHAGERQ